IIHNISLLYTVFFFYLLLRRHPISTLFPYTTLFRSVKNLVGVDDKIGMFARVRHHRCRGMGCSQIASVEWRNVIVGGEKFRIGRSEEHTSELQSRFDLVCRLLLEKKKIKKYS